jgi:hypothetical protein
MNKVQKKDDDLPPIEEYLLNGGGKSLKDTLLKILFKDAKNKKRSKKVSRKKRLSRKKNIKNKK